MSSTMPKDLPQSRFQFSLAALLATITVVSVLFSSIACNGLAGTLVGLPVALGAMTVLLGGQTRGLRRMCLVLAACGMVLFLLLAGASYPFIVIADSDLGMGAMARVGDWMRLCGACLLAGALIGMGNFIASVAVRLALTAGLLSWVVTRHFQSADTPYAARMGLVALAGLLLAADGLPALTRRARGCPAYVRYGWVLAIPALLLLTDWQGRVYRGLVPSSSRARAGLDDSNSGTSASLMSESSSQEAVTAASRLRAKGDEHGNLLVESLDGGAAFRRPPDNPDCMVSFVLFSPNGRTLAVGDNHRMYLGSKITIWDVAPGADGAAPCARLRHELCGGEHWYFAASFFPDGQTLVTSNGDKTVSLWDVASGKEIASFVAHDAQPWGQPADCVCVSPDGKTFATWAINGMKVWDSSSLCLLRAMDTREAIPIALTYTSDGGTLVAVDRERVTYWKTSPSPVPVLVLAVVNVAVLTWIIFAARRAGTEHVTATMSASGTE